MHILKPSKTYVPRQSTRSSDSGRGASTSSRNQRTSDATVPAGSSAGGRGSRSGEDETSADEAGEAESDPTTLPLDQVFEVLKNSRRRQTLHYLRSNGREATLSELAERIAAVENDTTVDAISSSQRKRVYVGLYQCHLPKMDDMDIVDFDKNRGTIELAANADQLAPYLDDSEGPAWYRLYGAVTAVGVGLLAVSLVGSAPLGFTPATVLAALLAVLALCSGVHAYADQQGEDAPTATA
jgi:hypothetical protein